MGMKGNAVITWTELELKGLLEDEDSHVYFERAKRHLGLHPFHLTDLNAALREILGSTLNRYDAKLNGIILSYKNPKLTSRMGEMLYDACYIHIDIESDFYVFRPEVGHSLKGIVNKKSQDHVGILVHKAFNVAIPRPDGDEDWPGHDVRIGQEVRFTVTRLDFKGRLPYILGSLDSEDYMEGCKTFNLKIEDENDFESKHGGSKILFDDDGEAIATTDRVSKKSKKGHRVFDSDNEEEAERNVSRKIRNKIKKEVDVDEEVVVIKSNKKKNKVKVETEQITDESDFYEARTKGGKKVKNNPNESVETKKKKNKYHDDSSDEIRESSSGTSRKMKKRSIEKDKLLLENVTVKIEPDWDDRVSKKKANKRNRAEEASEVYESDFSPKKKKKHVREIATGIVNSTRYDDSVLESNESMKKPDSRSSESPIISGHLIGFVQKSKKKSLEPIDEEKVARKIKKERIIANEDSPESMEKPTKVKSDAQKVQLNDLTPKQSKKKQTSKLNISAEDNEVIHRIGVSPQKNVKSADRKNSGDSEEIVIKKKKRNMSNGNSESFENQNESGSSGAAAIGKYNNNKRESSKSKSIDADVDTSIVKEEPTERKKKKSKGQNGSTSLEDKAESRLDSPRKSKELSKELREAKAKYEQLAKEMKKKSKIKVEFSD